METVIKWDRPQMVGEYYEPYRIDVADAIEELAKMFSGENWSTYKCGRDGRYVSDWEAILWG